MSCPQGRGLCLPASGLCRGAYLRPGGPASLVSGTADPMGVQSVCLGTKWSESLAWPPCSGSHQSSGTPPASWFLVTQLSSPLDFVLIAYEKRLVTGGCVCFHV